MWIKSNGRFISRVTSSSSLSLKNWAFPWWLWIGCGRWRPSLLKRGENTQRERWWENKGEIVYVMEEQIKSGVKQHTKLRSWCEPLIKRKCLEMELLVWAAAALSCGDSKWKRTFSKHPLLFWRPQIKELFFYIQDHICCFSVWQFDFHLKEKVSIFNIAHCVHVNLHFYSTRIQMFHLYFIIQVVSFSDYC